MIGRLLCSNLLGLHRVVTTREGKTRGSAASQIHVFCVRPHCRHRFVIDVHEGDKRFMVDSSGHEVQTA